MAGLRNAGGRSQARSTLGRFLRFGVLRGLRTIEIDPEDFRRELSDKHGLWVPDFARMVDYRRHVLAIFDALVGTEGLNQRVQ